MQCLRYHVLSCGKRKCLMSDSMCWPAVAKGNEFPDWSGTCKAHSCCWAVSFPWSMLVVLGRRQRKNECWVGDWEIPLLKWSKELRQLNETAYRWFRKKISAFEIVSFQFLFQNHTKHYHPYYVAVAFKTLLPWHTVKKKTTHNILYITTKVIHSLSFLSPFNK